MRHLLLILFSVALFGSPIALRAELVEIPWLGTNLLANADFEDIDGDISVLKRWHGQFPTNRGVALRTDSKVRLSGKNSLKIFLPQSDSRASVSSDFVPIDAGQSYLVTMGFCQKGFNRKGAVLYEGVNSHPFLQWYDKKKGMIGKSDAMSGFPYGPSRWDMRDGIAIAPTNASYARFGVNMGNNSEKHVGETIPSTLWIDAVQLREYHRPETPDWAKGKTELIVDGGLDTSPVRSFFLAGKDGFGGQGGKWSKVVVDKDAERGSALCAPANSGAGMMAHSSYFSAMPPGLYRLRARVKVTDNTAAKRAGCIETTSQLAGLRLMINFHPRMFSKADQYQDFEKDFILRDNGWWCVRANTDGNQSWSIDSVKVFPLYELEDRQLFSIYPGSAGDIDASLVPRRRRPYKALFIAGFGYDFYRPVKAIRLLSNDITIQPAWVYRDFSSAHIRGFPETPEELFDYSIVYLGNVPVKSLTLQQKNFLYEYVRRGGGLVVLGGHQAYERGGGRGSLLEETMPVEMVKATSEGMLYFPGGVPLTVDPDIPWLAEISVEEKLLVYFLHNVGVKKGSMVLARAGGTPFLVGGEYEKGRVICVLGLPLGDPGKGATGFWKWNDWTYLLRDVSWWTMRAVEIEAP